MSTLLQNGAPRRRRSPAAPERRVAIPPQPPHAVERTRIHRLLDAAAVEPLTLVVAPVGTGKTVAVSAWAAGYVASGGTLAWVSVDRTAPGELAPWPAIVDALRAGGVDVPSLVSLSGPASDDRSFPTMLGAQVACHPDPVVLVLDCAGPPSVDLVVGLERLLAQSAGRLRAVLLSRNDPPLARRHRLAGAVTELRAADLAFRPDEAAALLNRTVDAEAWQDVARYAIDELAVAGLLGATRPDELTLALTRLPAAADGPGPSVLRAVRAMVHGDVAAAAVESRRAREELVAVEPWPQAELVLELLDVQAGLARGDGEHALCAVGRAQGWADLVDPERRAAHPELDQILQARTGDALVLLGRLRAAAQAYAASLPSEAGDSEGLGLLALVEALRGELRAARGLADRALSEGDVAGAARVALAWVAAESDDLAGAREHVTLAGVQRATVPGVLLALVDARLRRLGGDLDGAHHALLAARLPTTPAWLSDLLRLERGSLELASGDWARALATHASLADPTSVAAAQLLWRVRLAELRDGGHARTLADPCATLADRVDGWVLEASRRLSAGETASARRALRRALSLAAPEQLRRPFTEAPADVRRLLREDIESRARPPAPPGFASSRPAVVLPGGGPLVEPLTEKEREVLGHLSALLSTEEIAEAMFVSVNTVRTHVRNILRKLAASRRNEAVRRARALHLIPG